MKLLSKLLSIVSALVFSLSFVTAAEINAQAKSVKKTELSAENFVHAEGTKIIGTDGKELEIRGIALGNSIWSNPSVPNEKHHTETSYKELSSMGFNCVRFYINYGLFESDLNPYTYKKSGFDWLDRNIKWAKKYNMGIILNMHYPQGGYQSQGEGLELWTDKSNQDRLTALWKAIAKRYADEPTIWGYGLINEPYAPLLSSTEETVSLHHDVMKRITKEIRSVSPYQAVFAEGLMSIKDTSDETDIDWNYLTPENQFAQIDDDNVIYEFHCYTPFRFTHQDADWAGTYSLTMSYPSDNMVDAKYINSWTGCTRASKKSSAGEWSYFESENVTMNSKQNVASIALNAGTIGSGAAYFDDIVVTETSPTGKSAVKYNLDFKYDALNAFYPWSSDGTGTLSYCTNLGRSNDGCIKITGANGDYTAGSAYSMEMKKGYKYKISGYIKTESTETEPSIRLDFALADSITYADKNALEAEIKKYADYSKKYNVPLYLGEFGVISNGFKENRGGTVWVSDMIDICRKYNIGFNYHTYHETSFGLYLNSDAKFPDKKNTELAELFKKKFIEEKN